MGAHPALQSSPAFSADSTLSIAAVSRPMIRRGALAFVASAAVVFAALFVAGPAQADTAPPSSTIPATVSTTSLPTAQINGVVWDQVIIGDTVYAGGDFTKARPAGSAAGVNETPRTYLLSYTLSTGVLTSFAPVLNGQVRALDVSPDGKRLYAVGAFTTVNGVTHNRVVAFNTATGAVDTTFAGSANGQVYAVTANASAVYIGGTFTQTSGIARAAGAAAFNATTSAVLPWAPTPAGGRIFALEVSPDASKVVLAGNFTTLNGNGSPGYGMGAVDTSTGASAPWAVGTIVKDAGENAAVYNLDSDADNVYGSVYTFGTGGNLEGGWSANWSGAVNWVETCHGDTYSVAAVGNAIYYAGHTHACDTSAGFPGTTPESWHRGVAYSKTVMAVNTNGVMAKQPQPLMLQFFPTINAGTYTGQNQGPWSVAGNSQYVAYAGEFTMVNNKPQQGLVRFPSAAVGPNTSGPVLFSSTWPITATSNAAGTVTVSWPANYDPDNQNLSYTLTRNGTSIYTTSALSVFWDQSTLSYVDTGATAGASAVYKVTATDPFGNVSPSATATVTVASTGTLSPYATAVFNSSPTWYYRLGETSGNAVNSAGPVSNTTLTNDVLQAVPATVGSGATRGVAGAIASDSDAAMQFNGAATSRAYSTQQTWADDSVSVEGWFKTTTSSGKIVGFGNSASSTDSTTFDRQLYVNNSKVVWSVNDGAVQNLTSTATVTDGKWHYVVGSVGPDGMYLYLDGSLVASKTTTTKGTDYWGYWHIGGDATGAGNTNFTGSIDEVAIYKTPLTASQVSAHYAAATGGTVVTPPANVPPTAAFTSTKSGLTAAFDGTSSTDSDGTISSYAWKFGDSTTAVGSTASHTYAAAGTYSVALTVTDNSGASTTVTKSITVAVPVNAAPTAAFTATASNLAITADGTASTDSDGTVASYAWNFGDSTTGTGATVSHTYAAAGTYNVVLTVTDNSGATGTLTKAVTVTAAPAPGVLASDAFGRTIASNGWGTADAGGAWTTTASANYLVTNGTGNFLVAAGTTRRAVLTTVSSSSTDVQVQIAVDKAAVGGPYYAGAVGRQVGSDYYQARVRYVVGGSVELQLMHGSSTVLTDVVISGLTYTPGQQLQLRLQVTGLSPTTLRAKVWAVGSTEPTAWATTTTDATAALQAAGYVGTESYASSAATNAPITVSYDNFSATTLP